jgi:hypothetical protein
MRVRRQHPGDAPAEEADLVGENPGNIWALLEEEAREEHADLAGARGDEGQEEEEARKDQAGVEEAQEEEARDEWAAVAGARGEAEQEEEAREEEIPARRQRPRV